MLSARTRSARCGWPCRTCSGRLRWSTSSPDCTTRRSFNELAEHQISTADRDSTGLDLLYLDVDAFKEINDSYGHAAGDETLQVVARLLQDVCRSSDVVARLGGDEFAVLMRDATPDQLAGLADRIASGLATSVAVEGHPPVTVSIGVSHHEPGRTLGLLLAAADREMYAEKARRSPARAALREQRRGGLPVLGSSSGVEGDRFTALRRPPGDRRRLGAAHQGLR
jgi:diguanylate cyclase (GGDEF)-like protein